MTNDYVLSTLASGSEADLIDLNDYAVNVVRDYCREKGYNPLRVVYEETLRIGNLDLANYLKLKRYGSTFRLTRSVRRAVFAAVATRKALS